MRFMLALLLMSYSSDLRKRVLDFVNNGGSKAEILERTCAKYGKVFAKAGKWTPTTKACHVCKHKNESITLSDRYWTCRSCGTFHDRDVNAATNILQAGVPVS